MIKSLVHITSTPCINESRIIKESKAAIDSQLIDKVYIIAVHDGDTREKEKFSESIYIRRFKLLTKKLPRKRFFQHIKYAELIVRILVFFCFKTVSIVQSHSLIPLPASVLLKMFKRAYLIYDAHELESAKNGCSESQNKKHFSIEKKLLPKINEVLVVSESIGEWYCTHHTIKNLTVVKNIPEFLTSFSQGKDYFHQNFAIPSESLVFIYQGAFFYGRGIPIILDAFAQMPEKHIIFMGYGELAKIIHSYSLKYPNIHFHPAVHPNEILSYTQSADIGIHIPENVCLSYYLSLPNKYFEYLASGIPVIVSNFPEMEKVTAKYDIGWSVNPDLNDLVSLIKKIRRDDILKKSQKINQCLNEHNWEIEKKNYLQVLRKLLKSGNGDA